MTYLHSKTGSIILPGQYSYIGQFDHKSDPFSHYKTVRDTDFMEILYTFQTFFTGTTMNLDTRKASEIPSKLILSV